MVVTSCEYHLVDLSAYPDEALRGAVILQVTLLTFKYIFREELSARLPGILALLLWRLALQLAFMPPLLPAPR